MSPYFLLMEMLLFYVVDHSSFSMVEFYFLLKSFNMGILGLAENKYSFSHLRSSLCAVFT